MGKLISEMISARAAQWPTNPNIQPVGSYEIPDRRGKNRPRPILAEQPCSAKNGWSGSNGHEGAWVCFGGAVARAWLGEVESRNWFGYNDISDPLLFELHTPNSGARWGFWPLVSPMVEGGPIYLYVRGRHSVNPRRTKLRGL